MATLKNQWGKREAPWSLGMHSSSLIIVEISLIHSFNRQCSFRTRWADINAGTVNAVHVVLDDVCTSLVRIPQLKMATFKKRQCDRPLRSQEPGEIQAWWWSSLELPGSVSIQAMCGWNKTACLASASQSGSWSSAVSMISALSFFDEHPVHSLMTLKIKGCDCFEHDFDAKAQGDKATRDLAWKRDFSCPNQPESRGQSTDPH